MSLGIVEAIGPPTTSTGEIPPSPLALGVDFTYSPAPPMRGEVVTFTGAASGGIPPYIFSWTFGDGGTGIGQIATHTFGMAGSRTVTLTVADSNATVPETGFASKSFTVTALLAADFTFSPANPVVGQTVSFSGSATGGTTPYAFSWDFGDGATTSGQNVGHAFSSANTFTVVLTVPDSAVPPHTAPRSKSVPVVPALVADFSFSPTNPVIGQTVTFSATASGGTPTYTFSWSFGDGTPSAAGPTTVTHAYSGSGTFVVTLTVTDSAARVVTVVKFITVAGVLTADFTYSPANPAVGQAVTFSATASGGTQPYAFSWSFGDGTPTAAGPTVSHAYGTAGNYTVTLTVSDSASHFDTAVKTVTLMSADFTFSPANPALGQTVTFSATAVGGTPPYTFSWAFGDGTPGATGRTATHAYATGGTFVVTLTARDSIPRTVTVTKSITVASVITANFTFSPAAPSVGELITFQATASGGTPPYTFSWTFGDGGSGTGPTVSRSYASAGTFTVILTARDSSSQSSIHSKAVAVSPALDSSFTVSQTKPVVGEIVNFSASSAGGTPPYMFSWTFGDGGNAAGPNVTHAYAAAGTFTVTLRVTDSVGHLDTVTRSMPVSPALSATFTFSPPDPVVGEEVFFTGTATGGTGPYQYSWTFGDGAQGIGFGPAHKYASVGLFSVVLTVFDSASHQTNVTRIVTVSAALGTTLTVSQAHPVVGEKVRFSATASGGSPPYTFTWRFGDGLNATGASVEHAYATDGSFDVIVTATDASGRRGVADRVLVVAPLLTADFSPSQNASAGDRIVFVAAVEGGTQPYNYTWAFGDGGIAVGPIVDHVYSAAGNFTVSLAVSDSANHTAAILKSFPVASRLFAEARYAPSTPLVGERITFSGNASGGRPPYVYDWMFGDGEVGTGASVTHFYVNATRFTVTLNVTDAVGRFAVFVIEVVTGPNLAVSFRFEPSMPISGRPVTFVPAVSGGIPPYTYAWTFGDPGGSTSDAAQPTHQYAGSNLIATFRVRLQVCDSAGHCVSASQDVTLVNWIQVATIVVSVGIASVLVFWFVRRFRAQRWMFRSAGQTAWNEASRFKRDVAGRVRRLRNDRFRRGPESGGNR